MVSFIFVRMWFLIYKFYLRVIWICGGFGKGDDIYRDGIERNCMCSMWEVNSSVCILF